MPELVSSPKVQVESLENFLLKEKDGLASLMDKMENEANSTYSKNAPRPEILAFKGGDRKSIRDRFLRALRVNTGTPLGYYLQNLPGQPLPGKKTDPNTVSLYGEKDLKQDYEFYDIRIGDLVSPIDVLATAGDEPDFGLDLNLFLDNGEELGKDYGFGIQSFGDSKVYYATQVPFHIGYYHESPIIFLAADFLTHTYPRYRVFQFQTLSRYAFQTGHKYWGYRFLGWGMHYIGDLTQPYHARVLPNYGTLSMLWINIKAIFGFENAKNDAIDRISNRHQTIEKYHFSVLKNAYAKKDLTHPFIRSVKLTDRDEGFGKYNDSYIVDVVTKESWDISDRIDTLIDDSNLLNGFAEGKLLPNIDQPSLTELDSTITEHMKSVGAHLRNYVRAGLL
ncbi:phospholipase [Leptospira langatensis]|uniref:Phospholipase n=2 Tax=Leptospira langatensis TaxID=2484983 RepID=A0A5F2A0N6_9LEPT|nr:phospholipase [Leptospira langatensis]TGL43817.1 phospholipase [Leptospira langatensis]